LGYKFVVFKVLKFHKCNFNFIKQRIQLRHAWLKFRGKPRFIKDLLCLEAVLDHTDFFTTVKLPNNWPEFCIILKSPEEFHFVKHLSIITELKK
jgi:hypothetical protein